MGCLGYLSIMLMKGIKLKTIHIINIILVQNFIMYFGCAFQQC